MTGPIALHGGGEFLPGDEPFLEALLKATGAMAAGGRIRACIVPTAAARGRPESAAAHGETAIRSAAVRLGADVEIDTVMIVDRASAADRNVIEPLRTADLVYLPGGDPDLIPDLLTGSRAWALIRAAWQGGAMIAGASAGAMALTDITWTPDGLVTGLGLVTGVLVLPHANAATWSSRVARSTRIAPEGTGFLGLAERTGLLGRPGEPWQVVGRGEIRWLPPGAQDVAQTLVRRPGEQLILPNQHLSADGPRVTRPTAHAD